MVVQLQSGPWQCSLRPDLGGSIASLHHGSTAVLRAAAPAQLASPRDSACFPLLPYSNRIRDRRFTWQGRAVTLAENFANSPHSLHGVGWLRAWQVQEAQADSVLLHYTHTPDAHWPFAFAAEQHLALTAEGLQSSLSFTNTEAATTQPVGLGWHPYFPGSHQVQLHMEVSAIWEKDAMEIPVLRTPHAPIHQSLADTAWDHCFDGFGGVARMVYPTHTVVLRSDLACAVVFTPPHRRFFCVEPVSHVNNAINTTDPTAAGLMLLAPGAHCTAHMTIGLEPTA